MDQDDKMLNLGIGKYPEAVGQVLKNSGQDFMTTLESGVFGGDVQTGGAFGTAIGAQAIVDNGYMFDFYDGEGLDATLLGLAEADQNGNVTNMSMMFNGASSLRINYPKKINVKSDKSLKKT